MKGSSQTSGRSLPVAIMVLTHMCKARSGGQLHTHCLSSVKPIPTLVVFCRTCMLLLISMRFLLRTNQSAGQACMCQDDAC